MEIRKGDSIRMWGDPWLDNDRNFYIEVVSIPTFEDMVIRDFFYSRDETMGSIAHPGGILRG